MSHIERCAYAHQDHEDALADDQAAREAAVKQAHFALKTEFLAALSGATDRVATPEFLINRMARVASENIGNALIDRLLDNETMADLLEALRESECPRFAKFRIKAANKHADAHCDALAEINLTTRA